MAITQDGRVGQLITPLGKDVLVLHRFDGHEGLGQPFEFHVDALSEQGDVDFDKALGQSHTIKLATYQGKTRIIDGILTEAQGVDQIRDHYRYHLVLRPWFSLLGHKSDSRTYLNKNVKEILQDVYTRSGFSDFQFKTTADYDPIPYCAQYRETDQAFCSRLMEHYGIYYFFQHSEGKHTMVHADSRASHEPNPDIPKVPYLPVGGRGLRDQQRFGSWRNSRRRFRTGKVTLNDYDFTKPSQNLQSTSEAATNYSHSKLEVSDWRGKYTQKDKGEQFAKIRLEAEQAVDCRRHAEGDCPSGFPGSLISLDQHPTSGENGEYLLVRAHHRFGTQSYSSGVGGSGSYAGGAGGGTESHSGTFEFQPSDTPYRSQARTEKPRIYGACIAQVVAASGEGGEEISTNEYGQVQVQFQWDSAQQSYWARVVQPWAGDQWGWQFIPRVGMEVLVEFEQGDPDYPVVVGCLYNGNNNFPWSLPDKKNKSGVRSNSSKGGGGYNALMFDDSQGSEIVYIHAQKDLNVQVENDEERIVNHNQNLQVANNQVEEIQNQRKVTVDGLDELNVNFNRFVQVQGSETRTYGVSFAVSANADCGMDSDTLVAFVSGASSIAITPGSIIITSPSIVLNGPVAMSGPGVVGTPPMPIT